jgi:hypothetical protein
MCICLDVVVKITRFIIGEDKHESSSATEASLAMLANTTRDKNSKESRSLIETYEKLIARTIIIILLHFYFITHILVSYAPVNPKRRQMKGTLCSSRKIKIRTETKPCFYFISTLTVGCENLSLQSKYDKALHYCSDRSSFCHDLEMKTLIILLSNCHSISSS